MRRLLLWSLACSVSFSAACSRSSSNEMSFFVASVQAGDGGNVGGLAAADAHCSELAEAAGVQGRTWRAYLSSSTVNARDRIGNGPWYNARGVLIATNLEELHGAGNHITIQTARYENGNPARGPHDILTGSDPDGTLADGDATCHDWTSTNGYAVVGHSDKNGPGPTGSSWNSAHLSDGCSFAELKQSAGAALIYCFAAK
jgi:hypothetical protein